MLIAKSTTVFVKRFYDSGGEQVGALTIAPWIGGSRNSRLNLGPDDVSKIEMNGRTYRLEYEVSKTPGLTGNDIQYFLMDGGTTLATAATVQRDHKRAWLLTIDSQQYALVSQNTWLRLRFVLLKDDLRVGAINETTRLLAVTRTYEVMAPPSFPLAVQAFMYHLAATSTYHT